MYQCHSCPRNGGLKKCDDCEFYFCGVHIRLNPFSSETKCWRCCSSNKEIEQERREEDAQRRVREQKKEELMREYERKEAEVKVAARKAAMERASKQFEEWKTQNPEWESQQREKFFEEMEQKWEKHLDGLKKEQMDIFFMYQNNL